MEIAVCERCGASDFVEDGEHLICSFCRARYEKPKREARKRSHIALDDDVSVLLAKCESDPRNARRYARLILEMDPFNEAARRYC